MKIKNIASSSKGNCTHIYTDRASILIDAGISMKKILNAVDHAKTPFNAIFVTHEHGDHIGGVGPIARKFKIPVYVHEYSYRKFEKKLNGCEIIFLDPTETYTVQDLQIKPFSTPHDSAYSVGYTIFDTNNKKRLGYLTDCGSFTRLMFLSLKGCNAYMIEADYDEQKLASHDEYDDLLKDRIASNVGHLSNQQCMEFLKEIGIDHTEFVMFCHLSERTNSPQIVLDIAKNTFSNYENFLVAPNENVIEL